MAARGAVIYLPDRRWYLVAAALATVALLALRWPSAGSLLLLLDLAWLLALVIDGWRLSSAVPITVSREAPPAFSVGRPLPVRYRWSHAAPWPLTLRVRERFPAPLEPPARERQIVVPAGSPLAEQVELRPVFRGKAAGGTIHLRLRGPWGLVWRQLRREQPWQATVYP
ncbi:MAG TPA: hypothetical protein VG817_01030, partial [Gemmatimonadales bacterium]|nr:hypothetical protein [Gemmatimonadales bacterium]